LAGNGFCLGYSCIGWKPARFRTHPVGYRTFGSRPGLPGRGLDALELRGEKSRPSCASSGLRVRAVVCGRHYHEIRQDTSSGPGRSAVLLDDIDVTKLISQRDRASIGLMIYSFPRLTVMGVRVADGHVDGGWIIGFPRDFHRPDLYFPETCIRPSWIATPRRETSGLPPSTAGISAAAKCWLRYSRAPSRSSAARRGSAD
jgi:hypothetical protein